MQQCLLWWSFNHKKKEWKKGNHFTYATLTNRNAVLSKNNVKPSLIFSRLTTLYSKTNWECRIRTYCITLNKLSAYYEFISYVSAFLNWPSVYSHCLPLTRLKQFNFLLKSTHNWFLNNTPLWPSTFPTHNYFSILTNSFPFVNIFLIFFLNFYFYWML